MVKNLGLGKRREGQRRTIRRDWKSAKFLSHDADKGDLVIDSYTREVGRRLRETAWELGYRTQQQLAEYLGVTRGQVYTWYRGLALPPVKHMQRLCREHRLTLDWIYSGDGSGLTYATYIRLTSAMEGKRLQDVPPEEEAEPEPDDSGAPGAPVVDCSPPAGARKAARAA